MTAPLPQIWLAANSLDKTSVSDWLSFLFSWGLPFTAYLIVQVFVPFRLQGIWRRLALLPIPIMAYVVYVSVVASTKGSNIWPIPLILASPVALLFLLLLFVFAPKGFRLSKETEEGEEVRL